MNTPKYKTSIVDLHIDMILDELGRPSNALIVLDSRLRIAEAIMFENGKIKRERLAYVPE